MIWRCKEAFSCFIADVAAAFLPGDTIPDDLAADCNLAAKPDIAEQVAAPSELEIAPE